MLAAPISIAGKEYICEVIVEQRPNRQGFYLHEVEVKEKLGNVFKTATQGSTRQASRSILALRNSEVNTIWEKCSKTVDENGEPLVEYRYSAYISKPHRRSGKSQNIHLVTGWITKKGGGSGRFNPFTATSNKCFTLPPHGYCNANGEIYQG